MSIKKAYKFNNILDYVPKFKNTVFIFKNIIYVY